MLVLIHYFISVVYTVVITCACVYIILPIVIKYVPSVVVQGTFLNLICSPRRVACLHKPKEAWKLNGVKHHYIMSSNSGMKLGVCHLLPSLESSVEGVETEEALANAKKVVIYCHGNAGHRFFGHRKSLYSMLRNLGFHVITFDYRGYGDSEGWPSEDGVIDDTVTVYKWVVEKVTDPDCEVLVWGHSLGTAIATQAVLKVQIDAQARTPSGLILEAPFTSAVDAMTEYPLSKYLARIYPGKWMEKIFQNALTSKRISFHTVQALPKLSNNILILHAQDDTKVHFRLGKKLFDETKKKDCGLNVTFAAFKACHGLGHNGIWQHPKLPSLVENLSAGFTSSGFVEIEI